MQWPLKTTSRVPSQGFGVAWSVKPRKQHTGIDLPAKAGSQILACASGMISKIGSCGIGPDGDWGRFVLLKHDSDDLTTCYLHTDPQVNEGQHIDASAVIGTVKDLKKSSHLHFGIWKGQRTEITPRGALPFPQFAGKEKPLTDPVFPSSFIDPLSFVYGSDQQPTSTQTFDFPIKRDLSKGCAAGLDVKVLQQLLNRDPQTSIATSGPGSPGQESSTFGGLTERAVQRLQEKYGIVAAGQSGYGIVGSRTRSKLEELFRQSNGTQ
mgnify:FL=1